MQALQRLDGKVAVVTGGASGIGRAIAHRLIRQGMRVVIADVEPAALAAAAAQIGAVGILTDVASNQSVQALAAQTQSRFGRVDLFCSNAGVGSTAAIADMMPSDWNWLLGVNLWGAIHGIQAFLPLLKANRDGGNLIITASEIGFHAAPRLGAYAVSKAALIALAESLALELQIEGSKIRVTVVCPGPVRSRLGASQRNRAVQDSGSALLDQDLEATPEGRLLRWMDPEVVAERLLQALEQGHFYVFTHPELFPLIQDRHERIAAAMAAAQSGVGSAQ